MKDYTAAGDSGQATSGGRGGQQTKGEGKATHGKRPGTETGETVGQGEARSPASGEAEPSRAVPSGVTTTELSLRRRQRGPARQ